MSLVMTSQSSSSTPISTKLSSSSSSSSSSQSSSSTPISTELSSSSTSSSSSQSSSSTPISTELSSSSSSSSSSTSSSLSHRHSLLKSIKMLFFASDSTSTTDNDDEDDDDDDEQPILPPPPPPSSSSSSSSSSSHDSHHYHHNTDITPNDNNDADNVDQEHHHQHPTTSLCNERREERCVSSTNEQAKGDTESALRALNIEPASPITSATPRTRCRLRARLQLSADAESNAIRRRVEHLNRDGSKNNDDDEDEDTKITQKNLFSPAQWRSHETDCDDDDRAREVQEAVDKELARVEALDENEFCPYKFIKSLPSVTTLTNPVKSSLPLKLKNAPLVSLVLDLDETLVHCSIEPILNAELTFQVNHCGVDYQVYARKRPFFLEFLEHVSSQFEVIVFTASQRVYADKLLDILDPHNHLFAHRLFRDDCHYYNGTYLKDLRVLGRDLSRVAIIDNSPQAFGFHVENGIPIESWFDDDDDDELLQLYDNHTHAHTHTHTMHSYCHRLPFLDRLRTSEDVRPIITKHFQLRHIIDSVSLSLT